MNVVRAELLVNNKVISESIVSSLSQRSIRLEERLFKMSRMVTK